jgi:hypothetical protein
VVRVVWSSMRGRLTPTVVFDPVTTLPGRQIAQATAHNAKYVSDTSWGRARVDSRARAIVPYIRGLRPALRARSCPGPRR